MRICILNVISAMKENRDIMMRIMERRVRDVE